MNEIFINYPGKSTIVIVAVPIGAVHETNRYKGISHFIEHLCFKGNPARNQKQISSAIDNVGGVLNAFTDYEITAYWAKVGNSHKQLAIDVITDLATKPLFPTKEIDKEREVIIQELKMYQDDPKTAVSDLFNEVLYSKDCGLNLSVIGTKESLDNITRKNIIDYHKYNYFNPTLIIVGDEMGYYNCPLNVEPKSFVTTISPSAKDVIIKKLSLLQSNITIGYAVQTHGIQRESNLFALQILDAVYSDMSGRLFSVVREKHNLVYGVHFHATLYSNGTLQWNVTAGLDKNKIELARDLIIKELSRPISKQELEIALKKAIGNNDMYYDNITNIGYGIANSLADGTKYDEMIFNYKERLYWAAKNINAFQDYLNFKKHILVGITPKHG